MSFLKPQLPLQRVLFVHSSTTTRNFHYPVVSFHLLVWCLINMQDLGFVIFQEQYNTMFFFFFFAFQTHLAYPAFLWGTPVIGILGWKCPFLQKNKPRVKKDKDFQIMFNKDTWKETRKRLTSLRMYGKQRWKRKRISWHAKKEKMWRVARITSNCAFSLILCMVGNESLDNEHFFFYFLFFFYNLKNNQARFFGVWLLLEEDR